MTDNKRVYELTQASRWWMFFAMLFFVASLIAYHMSHRVSGYLFLAFVAAFVISEFLSSRTTKPSRRGE